MALATLLLTTYGSPWGQRSTRELLAEMVKKRADLGLQEQTFNTDFFRLTLFVNRVAPRGGRLEGIFVYDSRERQRPQTIYARHGNIHYDPSLETIFLRLFEGVVIRWGPELGHRQTVEFKSYELPMQLFEFVREGRKSEREMSLQELREGIRTESPDSLWHIRLVVELHQRFALPMGALLLCLLAVPLGLSPQLHGRTWGLIVGLLTFLIYYVIFTASWRLAFSHRLDPTLAPYLANLLCAVIAGYFWWRTLKELPVVPLSGSWQRLLPRWLKTRLRMD